MPVEVLGGHGSDGFLQVGATAADWQDDGAGQDLRLADGGAVATCVEIG